MASNISNGLIYWKNCIKCDEEMVISYTPHITNTNCHTRVAECPKCHSRTFMRLEKAARWMSSDPLHMFTERKPIVIMPSEEEMHTCDLCPRQTRHLEAVVDNNGLVHYLCEICSEVSKL